MGVSIRMTEEEAQLVRDYAKLNGVTISQAIKEAIFEKIEDELDLQAAKDAYAKYMKGGKKSHTAEEVDRKYGIL